MCFFKPHSSSVLCCRACVLAQCSGLSLWFLLFSPANIKVCFWFIWTALRFWILFLNSVIHDTLSDFQFLKKVLIINWTFHLTAQDYSSDSLLHFHEPVGCLRLCTSARQKIPSSACVTWSKRISGSKLVCDIFVRTSRWRPVLTGYVFWKVWDRMGTARWCCGWHCYLTKILRQQFLCTLSVLVLRVLQLYPTVWSHACVRLSPWFRIDHKYDCESEWLSVSLLSLWRCQSLKPTLFIKNLKTISTEHKKNIPE